MFGQRYQVFDNEAWSQEQLQEQVQALLHKSDQLQPGFAPEPAVRPRLLRGPVPDRPQDLGPALVQVDLQSPMRLVLLGLAGAGKSTSGNTILGSDKFRTSCGFNAESTKTVCESAAVSGREVTVVDTPGFSDQGLKPKKLFKEIMQSVISLPDGPHAFIIVVRLGRVSRRDCKLLELIPKLFDEGASKFTTVLFTHGDDLGSENIQDLIRANNTMERLVEKCQRRYSVFNNKQRDGRQVQQLLEQVEAMVRASGEQHCTSQILRLTTADRIKKALEDLWKRVKSPFTCCLRPETDSDEEELQPLATS